MGYGKKHTDEPEPDLIVEEDSYSNAQEAVPVPWLCGERKVALRWISRVYNQRAKRAPESRPTKK